MKKIIISPNLSRDADGIYAKKAAELLMQNGFYVVAENGLQALLPASSYLDAHDLYRDADAMVVLGGDGSILRASEEASRYGIPILAVNLGRLGYIAQLEKSEIEKLPAILSSAFTTEARAMLSVTLTRQKKCIFEQRTALNDAVITKANGHGLVEFSLLCNEEKVGRYRADGMIISTATGSTAYAMSAGGAVIDPALRIMEATPICAHSLKARPIVFSENASITLLLHETPSTACVTLDGEKTTLLESGDRLTVSLSDKVTNLISLSGGFCHILNYKMSDL